MKKIQLLLILTLSVSTLFAQWTPVNSGFSGDTPTCMWPLLENIVVGTDGGGVFQTIDNGENWSDINGDLGNLFVNDIRGYASETSMFVATQGGPFFTLDQISYEDCTSSGLENTDINYFWWGDEFITDEFMIGTNGGGVYASDEITGSWTDYSGDISGDGLIVNDIRGADSDDDFLVLATDGGAYIATESSPSWVLKNNGLEGDALLAKRLTGLGDIILMATHGGLYITIDAGEEWLTLIPDEKLNTVWLFASNISPTGFFVFAFGEHGFYSHDFMTYYQMSMDGISGEVTCTANNSTHLFIGVDNESKGGEIFRRPLEDFITGIDEFAVSTNGNKLEQNYPNPCNTETTISYSIEQSAFVRLTVFDVYGKEVQTLVAEYQQQGEYSFEFNTANLKGNTFFYQLIVENKYIDTKKMMLLH